jgi:thioredoxin reductase
MRTSNPDIYAAGDVSEGFDTFINKTGLANPPQRL